MTRALNNDETYLSHGGMMALKWTAPEVHKNTHSTHTYTHTCARTHTCAQIHTHVCIIMPHMETYTRWMYSSIGTHKHHKRIHIDCEIDGIRVSVYLTCLERVYLIYDESYQSKVSTMIIASGSEPKEKHLKSMPY